jgi:hypothetical protein
LSTGKIHKKGLHSKKRLQDLCVDQARVDPSKFTIKYRGKKGGGPKVVPPLDREILGGSSLSIGAENRRKGTGSAAAVIVGHSLYK